MANYKQAPKLYHTGKKHNTIFYQLPQDLMDIIFTKLDGKCGNQIKLMCVLLGTQGNGSFGVSEKWICNRTGMIQQTYNKARKALINRGWLRLEEGKLFVLISSIYAEGTSSECAEEELINEGTSSELIGTTSELKTQFEDVPKAHSDDVYNIKEINNNNIKEIEKEKKPLMEEKEKEKDSVISAAAMNFTNFEGTISEFYSCLEDNNRTDIKKAIIDRYKEKRQTSHLILTNALVSDTLSNYGIEFTGKIAQAM